jgi:predicted hotdog family 3-hydroxylacyl-ACP dehydratase
VSAALQRPEYPPIEALLPHRDGMLLVDRVIESGEGRVRAALEVRAGAWYIDAQRMPAWIALEAMAQTVAACVGNARREQGLPPVQGYLLGTRRFRSARPAFPVGCTLEIVAERQYQETSGIGAFECRVEVDGERVADATLTVFDPS